MHSTEKKRISFNISLPSLSLKQCLQKVIFDGNVFLSFDENPRGVLEANGIKLDPSVTDEIIMRLKFTLIRARNFIVKEKIDVKRFEEIFGRYENIFGVREDSSVFLVPDTNIEPDSDITPGRAFNVEGRGPVEYSEKQSESNRGANTDWNKQDALSDSKSDHWSTTKFETDGSQLAHIKDRFIRTPLLDAFTLSRLITQYHIRMKEFGNY
jgi:hypothetical protein